MAHRSAPIGQCPEPVLSEVEGSRLRDLGKLNFPALLTAFQNLEARTLGRRTRLHKISCLEPRMTLSKRLQVLPELPSGDAVNRMHPPLPLKPSLLL